MEIEHCINCKHCVPCKHLVGGANGNWVWFKICTFFANEKDGWAMTVRDYDVCECFEERKYERQEQEEETAKKS